MFLHFLTNYPDEVEAGLAATYGIDLADFWRGRLSLRRVMVLTLQLPAGSALWQETGGSRAWDSTYEGLMVLEYHLRHLIWMKTEDGEKGRNAPEPVPPPKPAHEQETAGAKNDRKAELFLRQQKMIEARRAEARGG